MLSVVKKKKHFHLASAWVGWVFFEYPDVLNAEGGEENVKVDMNFLTLKAHTESRF